MTTVKLLTRADLPIHDFHARVENLQHLIEYFVREALDIPDQLNFPSALILSRMAKHPASSIRLGDLSRKGYYLGSNVSYSIKGLIRLGYIIYSTGNDRRTRYIELTLEGKQIGIEIADQIDFIESKIGNLFTIDSFKECYNLLARTVHNKERPLPSKEKRRV